MENINTQPSLPEGANQSSHNLLKVLLVVLLVVSVVAGSYLYINKDTDSKTSEVTNQPTATASVEVNDNLVTQLKQLDSELESIDDSHFGSETLSDASLGI